MLSNNKLILFTPGVELLITLYTYSVYAEYWYARLRNTCHPGEFLVKLSKFSKSFVVVVDCNVY
jgi:hypothetical protein